MSCNFACKKLLNNMFERIGVLLNLQFTAFNRPESLKQIHTKVIDWNKSKCELIVIDNSFWKF